MENNCSVNASPRKKSGLLTIAGWMLFIVLLAGSIFASLNYRLISDWWLAQQFKPSVEIRAMQQRIGVSERAMMIFKASQPVLQTSEQFNQNCTRQEVTSYILGCYTNQKIYVYKVNSLELDGVSEVTLAHELLHALYQRLDLNEKKRINQLLINDYQRLKTDELIKRMEMYQRTEPDQFENELHSILPTEFDDLSPELEQYFGRYFNNRSVVVSLHKQYNNQFVSRQKQMEELEPKIKQLTAEYQKEVSAYEVDVRALNQTVDFFNRRASKNEFSGEEQFNFERNRLLAKQSDLNNRYNKLKAKESVINQLVDQYNNLALDVQKLTNELDSLAKVAEIQ
ncbi:MAG: hypothetical protein Q3996_01210 [Candidatus Saccharibacteria bacterium]|nr:hypothetical protein [Candidatus Saccharibacteria bacterium]